MFKFIKRAIEVNKTYNELDRLTNRELSDLGITRADIRNIAKKAQNSAVF